MGEMDSAERMRLAGLIERQRPRRFETKRAAYTAAGVSPMTWDRALAGEPIREDKMRSIVRTLWPETEGDWTLIGTPQESEEQALRELVDELRRHALEQDAKIEDLRRRIEGA